MSGERLALRREGNEEVDRVQCAQNEALPEWASFFRDVVTGFPREAEMARLHPSIAPGPNEETRLNGAADLDDAIRGRGRNWGWF